MELGKHLVRELGFADSVDTLGRWMAHHVAELIDAAENDAEPARRAKSRKDAEETILRLWEHRRTMPGHAHPLQRYGEVLSVLHRLRPGANPFGYHVYGRGKRRDELAAGLFDTISRLIMALLFMQLPPETAAIRAPDVAVAALDKDEQRTVMLLEEWGRLFESESKRSTPRRGENDDPATQVELSKAAFRLTEGAMATLEALQASLHEMAAELSVIPENAEEIQAIKGSADAAGSTPESAESGASGD